MLGWLPEKQVCSSKAGYPQSISSNDALIINNTKQHKNIKFKAM